MSKRPLPPDGASGAWKRPRLDSGPVQVGGEAREISSVFDLSLMLYVNGYYIQGMLCHFAQTLPSDQFGTSSQEQVSTSASAFMKSAWEMGKVPLLKGGPSRPAVRYGQPVAADEQGDLQDAGDFQRSADGRCGFQGAGAGAGAMRTTDRAPLLPTPRVYSSAGERQAEGATFESTSQAARMAAIPVVAAKMVEASIQAFKQALMTSSGVGQCNSPNGMTLQEVTHLAQTGNCPAGRANVNYLPVVSGGDVNAVSRRAPQLDNRYNPGPMPAWARMTEPNIGNQNSIFQQPTETASQNRCHWFPETNSQNVCQWLTGTNFQNSSWQSTGYKPQNGGHLTATCPPEQFSEPSEKTGSQDKHAGRPSAQVTGNQKAPSALDEVTPGVHDPAKLPPPSSGLNPSEMTAGLQQNYRGWYTAVIPTRSRKSQDSVNPGLLPEAHPDANSSLGGTSSEQSPLKLSERSRSSFKSQSTAGQVLDASDSHQFETTFGKSQVTSTQVTFWQATSERAQETSEKSQVTSSASLGTRSGQPLAASEHVQTTLSGQTHVHSSDDARVTSDTTQAGQRQDRRTSEQSQVTLEQLQRGASEVRQSPAGAGESSSTCDDGSKANSEPSQPSSTTAAAAAKPSSSQVTFEQWQQTVRRIQESVEKLHQMQAHCQNKDSAGSAATSHRRPGLKDGTDGVCGSAKPFPSSSSSSSSSTSEVTSEVRPYRISHRDPRKMAHNKPRGFVRPVQQQQHSTEVSATTFVRPVQQQQQQQQHNTEVSATTDPRHSVTETATRMPADLPVPDFSSSAKKQRSPPKKTHTAGSGSSRKASRASTTDFPEARSASRTAARGAECLRDFARKAPEKNSVTERGEVSTQTDACGVSLPVFTSGGRSALVERVTVTEVGTMTSPLNFKTDDRATMTEGIPACDQQTMTTKPLTRDISTVPDTPLTLDTYTMMEPRHDVTTMTSPHTDQRGQQTSSPLVATEATQTTRNPGQLPANVTTSNVKPDEKGDGISRPPGIDTVVVAKPEVTQVCKIVTPLVTRTNTTAKLVPAVCELSGWHGITGEKDPNSVPLGIEISRSPGPQCVTARTLSIPAAGEGGGTVRIILRVKTRSGKFGTDDLKQQAHRSGGGRIL